MVPLMTCDSVTFQNMWWSCCACMAGSGPMRTADSPPARWRAVTLSSA